MYRDKKIAIVIPAYNEERFIVQVIRAVPSFVDHIIVVDDASGDSTSQLALEVADPRVLVLKNEANQGVGGSTITGYRRALELECDVVAKADGDGQMPLDRLSSLLEPIVEDGYVYTKGNRFLEQDSLGQMPKVRLLGNIALTFLTKLASGYWQIFDPQNGFTAIDVRALKSLNLDNIYKGYFFENDMLVRLNVHGFRVRDVPMPAVYGNEKSSMRLSLVLFTFPFLLFQRLLYRIYQKYVLRDFSPIALFLGVGTLLMGGGGLFGLSQWLRRAGTGVPTPTGTVMLSVIPVILGFQLVLQALVLDINETEH